ncbi:MAG TPA: HAMP domain-containing sensor histidine kinase [Anaerolineae bacterium]
MLSAKLSDRLHRLQWSLPAAITALAALYQLGPARYVHDNFGDWSHYALEVLFYGTTGPIVVWITLRVVRQWVEQKEQAEAEVYRLNAELQQRVDERTRELREKNEALAAANTQLQELDRLKSEFVSLVSHELRAPLTNVRGAIELMEGGCPALNPTCTRMFKIVSEQIGRLGRMVDEVLNVSRIETGGLTLAREAVDVVWVADRVIDEFAARDTRHRFRRPRETVHPRLWADADRLHEVVANLVDNAVKYSLEDTEVTLSVEVRDGEGIVSVSDRGPGIPFQEQSRVFEKFHRLDSGDSKESYGYGLGLYLCRRLVEAMGGRIWVESDAGHGATFRFALPLAE